LIFQLLRDAVSIRFRQGQRENNGDKFYGQSLLYIGKAKIVKES
jgi:hypothetical protein